MSLLQLYVYNLYLANPMEAEQDLTDIQFGCKIVSVRGIQINQTEEKKGKGDGKEDVEMEDESTKDGESKDGDSKEGDSKSEGKALDQQKEMK